MKLKRKIFAIFLSCFLFISSTVSSYAFAPVIAPVSIELFNLIVGLAGATGLVLTSDKDKVNFVQLFLNTCVSNTDNKVHSDEFPTFAKTTELDAFVKEHAVYSGSGNGNGNFGKKIVIDAVLQSFFDKVFTCLFRDKKENDLIISYSKDILPCSWDYEGSIPNTLKKDYSKSFNLNSKETEIITFYMGYSLYVTIQKKYELGKNYFYSTFFLNGEVLDGTHNTSQIPNNCYFGTGPVAVLDDNNVPIEFHPDARQYNVGNMKNLHFLLPDWIFDNQNSVKYDFNNKEPSPVPNSVVNNPIDINVNDFDNIYFEITDSSNLPDNPDPSPDPDPNPPIDPDFKPPFDVPSVDGIDFSPILDLGLKFTEKFPFSLPWDFKRIFDFFDVTPQAPVWTVPIVTEKIVIDLTQFSVFADITKFFVYIAFCVSLIFIFNKIKS